MWFAHAVGPLGTYVRVRWEYIVDLGECPEGAAGGGPLVSLSADSVDDLMALSSLDPDMVDVLRSSGERGVCVYLYGR